MTMKVLVVEIENSLVPTVSKCGIEEKFCLGIFRMLKILTCSSAVQVCCWPVWSVKHFKVTLRMLYRLAFLEILIQSCLFSVLLEGILSLALSTVEWTLVQFVGVYMDVGRPSAVLPDDLLSFWDLWWVNDFFRILTLEKLGNLQWDAPVLTR